MATYNGFLSTSHTDVFYNRIWLLPESLDFTGLPINTNISFSVWNSYTTQKNLNTLFPTSSISHIGFSPFSGGLYDPLELVDFVATNQASVPNYWQGTCLFDFTNAEDVTLTIQGQDFESFIYDNNWNALVTEYYSYLTGINTSKNGKEQRSRRRQFPRRGISYRINPANYLDESSTRIVSKRLENHLTFIYGKTTLIPIWQDIYRISNTLAANSNSISGIFNNLDFQAGNYVAFFQNINSFEIVKLNTVSNTTLTFSTNTTYKWAAGTKLVPLRKAIFSEDALSNAYEVSFLADITPKFSILAEEDDLSLRNVTYVPDSTYKGKDVVVLSNNFTEAQTIQITQNSRVLDFEHTIFAPDRAWQKDKKSFTFSKLIQTRADFSAMLGLFKRMCGAWKSFWLINKSCELEITDTLSSGANGFWIKDIGITRYRNVKQNPTYIYAIDYTGTIHMRRIVTSSLDTNNREYISLDSPMPVAISPTSFKAIGFMYLVRFINDDLEISWESDTVAKVNLNFVEVFDEL